MDEDGQIDPPGSWLGQADRLPTSTWGVARMAAGRTGVDDLTAEEVVGTYVTAATVGFVPSLVGVGLGTLAGLIVGPRRRPPEPTPFSQPPSPPTGDEG